LSEITLVVHMQAAEPVHLTIGYIKVDPSAFEEFNNHRLNSGDPDIQRQRDSIFNEFRDGPFRSFATEVMRRASNQRNSQELGMVASHAF